MLCQSVTILGGGVDASRRRRKPCTFRQRVQFRYTVVDFCWLAVHDAAAISWVAVMAATMPQPDVAHASARGLDTEPSV